MIVTGLFLFAFVLTVGGGYLSENGRTDAERAIGSLGIFGGVCAFLCGLSLLLAAVADRVSL